LEYHSVLEQKYLSGAQREKSMYGRYRAIPKAIEHYPRLLLVDDLYTTGATMRACSRMLRQNGAKSVSCVTLARVQHQYQP
jgi:predicted amidophosphoribosyltransferase